MQRALSWATFALGVCAIVILAHGIMLWWLLPRYATLAFQQSVGTKVHTGRVYMRLPASLVFEDVRLDLPDTPVGASFKRLILTPRSVSWLKKTVWLDARLEQPAGRFIRTNTGSLVLPALPVNSPEVEWGRWHAEVHSLDVVDGAIEFIDEKPARMFHGIFQHLMISVGTIKIPLGSAPVSFAARGQLVGYAGHAAPLYCSGWIDWAKRDLDVSCRLEPIPLAVIQPYLENLGRVQVRVYDTVLTSTSSWLAKDNHLGGRIQMLLENLKEGDISIRGKEILNLKRLVTSSDTQLSGELKVTGMLDKPEEWKLDFSPGTDLIQQRLKPMLDRKSEVINLHIMGRDVGFFLTPVSQEMVDAILNTSQQIQDSLKIIAEPQVPDLPPFGPQPAPQGQAIPLEPAQQP